MQLSTKFKSHRAQLAVLNEATTRVCLKKSARKHFSIQASVTMALKLLASFSYRVQSRRFSLSQLNSRSITLRFLYCGLSNSRGRASVEACDASCARE